MEPPTMQLAAIGMARWLENARGFWGFVPLVPSGGFILCMALILRGFFSFFEAFGLDGLGLYFGTDGAIKYWNRTQDVVVCLAAADVFFGLVGFAGFGGKNVHLVKYMSMWLLARLALQIVAVVLYCVDHELGRGWLLAERVVVAACLLVIDVDLVWTGVRLVLAAQLRWTLAPSMLHIVCAAQGVAIARGDTTCEKRHLLAVLVANYEFRRMLELARVDVNRMSSELTLRCDAEGERQPNTFLDSVPCGADLDALLHTAMHVQSQCGDELLRVDHLLFALCAPGEICVKPSAVGTGSLIVEGMIRYEVDGKAMSEQLATIRGHFQAAKALANPNPQQVAPTIFGPLELPLEETVLVYCIFRALSALISVVGMLIGSGTLLEAVVGKNVTAHESQTLEWLEGLWCISFNIVGIRAIGGHRRARKEVQAVSMKLGATGGEELDKAFDIVRDKPGAAEWLSTFRLGATGLAFLLLWGPFELFMDLPIMGLSMVNADVCHVYSHGIARVSSARIVPLSMQVPLHCTMVDLVALATAVCYCAFRAYMCWSVLALWHGYAFGWTTTDFRGAAYLIMNPFQPAFGFGEREKLVP